MTISGMKNLTANSTVSINGLVKAIFGDTIHIQIGGKVIALSLKDLQPKLGNQLSESK